MRKRKALKKREYFYYSKLSKIFSKCMPTVYPSESGMQVTKLIII